MKASKTENRFKVVFNNRKRVCKKGITINVPSNFLKSVCAQNFLCATSYPNSSIGLPRTTCMKYKQKKGKLNVRSKIFSLRSSDNLCAHTCAQLRGNIDYHP